MTKSNLKNFVESQIKEFERKISDCQARGKKDLCEFYGKHLEFYQKMMGELNEKKDDGEESAQLH